MFISDYLLRICRIAETNQADHTLEQQLVGLRAVNKEGNDGYNDSKFASNSGDDGEGLVWARSGVQADDYIQK